MSCRQEMAVWFMQSYVILLTAQKSNNYYSYFTDAELRHSI